MRKKQLEKILEEIDKKQKPIDEKLKNQESVLEILNIKEKKDAVNK